jgi:hypothetical protein
MPIVAQSMNNKGNYNGGDGDEEQEDGALS